MGVRGDFHNKKSSLVLANQATYRFDIKGNSFFQSLGRRKIPFEDYRSGESVREIIVIYRGNRDVQLCCIDAFAEDILPNTPIQKGLNAADEFLTDRLQGGGILDMGSLAEVFAVHEGDELGIGDIIFPGEADERFEGCSGGQVLEIQFGLFCPDIEVFPLQNRPEEAVLTFEIVIKHSLVGLGIQGNRIDPCTFKAVPRKFLLGRFENA